MATATETTINSSKTHIAEQGIAQVFDHVAYGALEAAAASIPLDHGIFGVLPGIGRIQPCKSGDVLQIYSRIIPWIIKEITTARPICFGDFDSAVSAEADSKPTSNRYCNGSLEHHIFDAVRHHNR